MEFNMSSIMGFASYLPERVVTHEALAAQLAVEPEWILQSCGIRERRYAAEGETVVDLAEKAARSCLERLAFDPAQLGAVLVGTGTPHRQFPGVSASLQHRLGCPGALALDVHLASSGGLVALSLAMDLCARYGPVLVVAAEKMSEVVQRHPSKETTILFGDGAGAALVTPGEGPYRLVDGRVACDGAFADDLCLEPGGPLVMNGRQVIMQAVRKLTATVKELLERNGRSMEDAGLFLFHQANLNLLRQVAKQLAIPEEKIFVNLERYGNTSAASLLIAAAEAEACGRFKPGASVVLAAFGAGFSCGSLLMDIR
jgi:3-oxoacyl-[acyl-carrier-protein] synthase-3